MHPAQDIPDGARLYERAACGLLVTETSGLIRTVNATFCSWLGYTAEALVGKVRFQDLFTIGGKVFHQTHLAPLLQMQGSVAEVQLDMRHADGSKLPMLINTVRTRIGERTIDEIAVFVASDRRKYEYELLAARRNAEQSLAALAAAQQQLQESRDVLGVAMRGAKMGVWSRDIGTGKVWFSSELEALAGIPEGSFEGTADAFFGLIHPDDLAGLQAAVDEALALVRDCAVEFRLAHGDGHWVPMTARMRVGCNASGTPTTVFGVAIDISHRVETETALRRDAAILADQSDAIMVFDAHGRIAEANMAAFRMTGYDQHELLGAPAALVYGDGHGELVRAAIEHAFARQQEWRGELRFMPKGAVEGYSEAVIKPLLDAKGQAYAAVCVSRDISERVRDALRLRELNEELARADRKKDEFLATLAHELRNPLAPLQNVHEILKMKSICDPQLQWAQEVFGRQMQQMSRLVDDMLEISRITQGRVELRRQRVDLEQVMRAAADVAQPLIQANGHRLSLQAPHEQVEVDADPARLTQVLTNLLNNAAKYTPDGGFIWFSAEAAGDEVTVAVRDSGIGIAADNLANVFTMFAQLEPGLERAQGGLGIGLALVKGLVELHGGTISVHSAGVGQGSEFAVRLPRLVCAAAAAPAERAHLPAAARGRRILVVDDNRDAADMLRMALELLGHEVSCAYDGAGALALGAELSPDVLILDIGLPDMDGYTLASKARALAWGQQATLIAATGWGQQRDKERATEAGFDLHMVKPLDIQALGEALAAIDAASGRAQAGRRGAAEARSPG